MKTMSSSYIGTVPVNALTNSVIDLVKASLKGTGFNISIFARNPNRKQFYGKRFTYGSGYLAKHYYAQNLPREYATSFALYVRPSARVRNGKGKGISEKTAVANSVAALNWALKS